MNFRDFVSDDKTSNAVVRKLEIIGESIAEIQGAAFSGVFLKEK